LSPATSATRRWTHCLRTPNWPDVYVLELSSFQLETTSSLVPTAATVLNVTDNHLDRYAGIDDYAAAKARVFQGGGTQVLNRDDLRSIAMRIPGRLVQTFGGGVPESEEAWGLVDRGTKGSGAQETWLARGGALLLPASDLTLVGRHNALNALAALALASSVAKIDRRVLEALARFEGLPHRMQRVADAGGVLYVDDSKGTTVAATRAALAGLNRPVILIAGGDGKGQDFTPLMEAIDGHCRAVLLIGRDAPAIGRALAGSGALVEHAGTLEVAVTRAMQLAKPGDAVVLSPACASLDQFANYVERGERYRDLVRTHLPRTPMPRDASPAATLKSFRLLKSWSSLGALPGNPRTMLVYDASLTWCAILLLAIGLVMVYSSSIVMAESSAHTGFRSWYFLARHAMFVAVGAFAAFVAFQIPMKAWQRLAPWIFVAGIVLLALVFIPGVGKSVNGSRRWISLAVVNLQPSEFMKLCRSAVCRELRGAQGGVPARRATAEANARQGFPFRSFLVMVAVSGLLLFEPDFGALVVIVTIAFGILYLGGLDWRLFLGLLLLLPIGLSAILVAAPYRLQRLIAFLDPWSDPFGKGYQLSHSLIAFGRGEWIGVGLGSSVEKLLYLPEAHTDFLLAVTAEELGFAGVVLVIGLFVWLLYRTYAIGRQAARLGRAFASLVALGIGIWIGVQAFINIGVNMGVLPTKGLTLPLLSFGGSGIVANCVAIAILLRADYENRRLLRGFTV
jgi:cell division protein FtsW